MKDIKILKDAKLISVKWEMVEIFRDRNNSEIYLKGNEAIIRKARCMIVIKFIFKDGRPGIFRGDKYANNINDMIYQVLKMFHKYRDSKNIIKAIIFDNRIESPILKIFEWEIDKGFINYSLGIYSNEFMADKEFWDKINKNQQL